MNKRKIFTLALTIAMVAILAIGGSLAYLTDNDAETNVFTVGNVKIDLTENFTQDAKLMPGSKTQNNVAKEVFVTNTGTEDAYVRVFLALPTILDDGDPSFDASKNILHFNNSNMGAGKWNWSTSIDGNDDSGKNYVTEGGEWNFFQTTINNTSYNVYVVTYETALKAGEKTPAAMDQVYMDGGVSSADMERLTTALGNKWKFEVFAQGVQKQGFETAYDAFKAAYDNGDMPANPWAN